MKKLVSLILVLAMLATLMVSAAADESKPYAGVKLTYWVKLHENLDAAKVTNMAQTRWYEAVKEATGIEIEFIHPAAGQDATEFNLLTAVPDEMPDIVEYSWTAYPGGASAAIDDEVIISLNDVIASGKAPHLKAILDNEVAIDKAVKTADGDYYVFPFLRGTTFENNNCLFTSGFYMRGDILKELNLEVPETIDEWDTVLRAVKAAHPDMIPFITRTEWMNQIFTPGYDNYWDYYVEDGVVKNGLAEDSHFEYLKKMASWYADGLLDPDYLTHTKAGDGRGVMAAGNAFATYDACGGGAVPAHRRVHPADDVLRDEGSRPVVNHDIIAVAAGEQGVVHRVIAFPSAEDDSPDLAETVAADDPVAAVIHVFVGGDQKNFIDLRALVKDAE